jgi:L-ascorbate metabolism protein UlaG (beta-lactamase superfamily)
VVISHNHYDHLDMPSVLAIAHLRQQGTPLFMVPLGMKAWFVNLGLDTPLSSLVGAIHPGRGAL